MGSIPGSGRSPGDGNGNPLQYSCLETPMDRGVWWVTVRGAEKSQTRLNTHTDTHSHPPHTKIFSTQRGPVHIWRQIGPIMKRLIHQNCSRTDTDIRISMQEH